MLQRLIDSESRPQQPGRPSHELLKYLRLAKPSDSLVLWLRAVAACQLSMVKDPTLQAMACAEHQGTGRRRYTHLRSLQATLATHLQSCSPCMHKFDSTCLRHHRAAVMAESA